MKNKTNDLITAALAPTRDSIVEGTVEILETRAASAVAKLKEFDLDAKKAFPINYNGYSVNADKAARNFALTTVAKIDKDRRGVGSPRDPMFVILRDALEVSEIIDSAANRHADDLLLSYAGKLTAKVEEKGGDRKLASVRYNGSFDPWGKSSLTATFEDGSSFILTTRIIVNVSKLGKLFNQFPTRLAQEFPVPTPAEVEAAGELPIETTREAEEAESAPAPDVAPTPSEPKTDPVTPSIPSPPSSAITTPAIARIFRALLASSAGNGHDFGFLDEVRSAVPGISDETFDELTGELERTGTIQVFDPVTTDAGTFIQFAITALAE